jgi:DNA-binding transcriptional LysR family regulator
MSDLEDIKSFVEVVETGGFGRAARHLGVSKAIVSKRVARLENKLGTRLLSRTTRSLTLTEAGLEFNDRCRRLLAELDEAFDAVAEHGGLLTGRLRVSTPVSFGRLHATRIFAEMAKQHPKLELDIHYSDSPVDLIAEGYDAAIRIGNLRDSSLVARRIAPIRAVVAASPDYLARHGRPQTPYEIAQHECLIYGAGSSVQEWPFYIGRQWVFIRPRGRVKVSSGEAVLQCAIEGLGLAGMPTFEAADAIQSGKLEAILLDYPMPEFGLYVVRPPGAHVPNRVRVLIDLLVERFGGEPFWDPYHIAHRKLQARAPEAPRPRKTRQ